MNDLERWNAWQALDRRVSLAVVDFEDRMASAMTDLRALMSDILPEPPPPPTVEAGADKTVQDGTSVQLFAGATGGQPPLTFRWSEGDVFSDGQVWVVIPTTGVHVYNVTVRDDFG